MTKEQYVMSSSAKNTLTVYKGKDCDEQALEFVGFESGDCFWVQFGDDKTTHYMEHSQLEAFIKAARKMIAWQRR